MASSAPSYISLPITSKPKDYEQILQAGIALVIEANAVTADGQFGIFFGHTFILTDGESEFVDNCPWELTAVR